MGAKAFIVRIFAGKSSKPPASDVLSSASGVLSMDQSREKQIQAVQKMRRGVADVSVSRQRLDLQAADLQSAMDKLQGQADASTDAGLLGPAQTAMARHLIMTGQLSDLLSQRDALAEQEQMLIAALTQLQARVSGFSVTVETLNAAQTAAAAHQSIARSLKDLGPDSRI